MMPTVLQPPKPLEGIDLSRSIFLAGSIEMGVAEDWQNYVIRSLDIDALTILNPRRDEWDASWKQSIENPQFREQVEWELTGQERATLIPMYFSPDAKAPITLLELGLFAATKKTIVCCPDGYWRKGNVEIVCDRYSIPMVDSLDAMVELVRHRLLTAA